MKTKLASLCLGVAAALFSVSPASNAQVAAFSAEIDCTGPVSPGDSVPYTVRYENQTLQNIPLGSALRIWVPGVGRISLAEFGVPLGPNQNLVFDRELNVPAGAPQGSYTMVIVAASEQLGIAFDTCSFNVN